MIYSYKLFSKFDSKLKNDWLYLEKNGIVPIFSSYKFHLKINELRLCNLEIFIIYDYFKRPVSIIPLEKINSKIGNFYTIHGSDYLDYYEFIFDQNQNLNTLSIFILDNIFKDKTIFLRTISSKNKLANFLIKNSKYNFKWINNYRFWIEKEKYEIFFKNHKKSINRLSKNINKYKVSFINNKTNIINKKYLIEKHIEFKSKQFNDTFTRNIFKIKNYRRFINSLFLEDENHEIHYLKDNKDEIHSIILSLITKTDFCHYQLSHNKKSNLRSPGKALMYESLKFCNTNNLNFDFSTGLENYKKVYATNKDSCNSIFISQMNFLNIILLAKFFILYNINTRNFLKNIYIFFKRVNIIK